MNRPPSTLIIGHNPARDLTRRDEIRRHAHDSANYYGRQESGIVAGICFVLLILIAVIVVWLN